MGRMEFVLCFQLQQHPVLHQQIDLVLTDKLSLVVNGNRLLYLYRQTVLFEFMNQCIFIDLLQKTMAQLTVNLEHATIYPIGQLLIR